MLCWRLPMKCKQVRLTVNLLFISALAFGQPAEFVANYYPIAKLIGERYGVAPEVILTQAALETGWGKNVKGNNFFGLKGRGQLCRTTEYHSTTSVKYPHIFSIKETTKGYKYVVLDHFRCYDYPIDSFEDYAILVKKIGKNHCSPYKFYRSLETYATNPSYYKLLVKVHKMVVENIKQQCL